jgi:AraC-like DNA-binding protein
LQRRLAAAGASFSTLLEGWRMEEALILLVDSQAEIGQISRLLGYSEPSAFSRAVAHWWGASPRALRKARGAPAPDR